MKYLISIYFLLVFISVNSQTDTAAGNYEYALIEAARQKMIGNIDESAALYSRVISYKPDCSVAYFELGNIYIALLKTEEAEIYYSKAYNIDKQNYWYMYAFAGTLKINKKYKEAIAVLKNFQSNSDNNNSILFSLAECYAEIGKHKKAVSILNEMERQNGVSEKLLLLKVDIYKKEREFEKGKRELLKLIDIIPEAAPYQILMAEYLEDFEMKEEAIRYYEAAYHIDSTNLFAITNLADYYAAQQDNPLGFYYLNRALTLNQIDVEHKINAILYYINSDRELTVNKDKVFKLINTLKSYYPNNYDVNTVLYDYYNKTGNPEKAYEIILEIIKEKKDNYVLWQQALFNASVLSKADDMIIIGNEALKYFPNKREIYLFIGLGYYQNEDFQKAYSTLVDNVVYIKNHTFLKQFYYFIAEAAYKIGLKEKSFEFFEKLIKEDPDNFLAINNYSYYLSLDKINLERAKELSYKTILMEPDNPVYLDTYGWILYQMGQYEEAHVYIEKAIDLGANDPDVVFHYAEVLFNLKEYKMARFFYNLALEKGYEPGIIENKILQLPNEN
jgi:tetratricopeptide (TPR) repeat protein